MAEKSQGCPFCGKQPEVVKPKSGPWVGFERSFHRCKIMGYIEISDWTEKVDFAKWNHRPQIKEEKINSNQHTQLKISQALDLLDYVQCVNLSSDEKLSDAIELLDKLRANV